MCIHSPSDMQRHVSILLDGDTPTVTKYTNSGLFHCPFCRYKAAKPMTDNHIKDHSSVKCTYFNYQYFFTGMNRFSFITVMSRESSHVYFLFCLCFLVDSYFILKFISPLVSGDLPLPLAFPCWSNCLPCPDCFHQFPTSLNVYIQFNSVLFIQLQMTTNVISRHLNNIVQFKPIGV